MKIHIARGGQQYGPYTLAEVNAQLASGGLSANDQAWHAGAPGWIMLAAVAGVVAPAPRTSRSMPPPQSTSVSPVGAPSGWVATVIPYKNLPALIGYYCGVFGIVLPGLGPVALVLGVIGLLKVSRNAQSKGSVHAWVAIVLGLLGLLVTVAWIALLAPLVLELGRRLF